LPGFSRLSDSFSFGGSFLIQVSFQVLYFGINQMSNTFTHTNLSKNLVIDIMRFKIILEEDEEVGGFIASCPGLPGCFSQGDTVEEAIENIKEAIQACLESLAEDDLQECIGKSSCRVVDVVA
jgi:predicted RNase H-like HicB family nuclease